SRDWSSDVCSSDLAGAPGPQGTGDGVDEQGEEVQEDEQQQGRADHPDHGRHGQDAEQQRRVGDGQPGRPGPFESGGGGAYRGRAAAQDDRDEEAERTDQDLGDPAGREGRGELGDAGGGRRPRGGGQQDAGQ